MRHAILAGKKVIPISFEDFCRSGMTPGSRRVGRTVLSRRHRIFVSTVFLGMDHSWGRGPQLWFETMIFGTSLDQSQRRYETWEQAQRGHEEFVHRARQARQLPGERIDRKQIRRLMRRLATGSQK